MSAKSIPSDSIHNQKSTRIKGGYEVWSMAIHSPIDPETWLTRMGAARQMQTLKEQWPQVEMLVVYVHYLQNPHERR